MSEQRDNSGAIFVNERKESDNHPDRTGSAMIGGREYWVSGWIKKSGDKPSFLSLAFKPKDAKPAEKLDGKRAGERPRVENMDSDIPW